MQQTITDTDINDFLDKLRLFVPDLGEYEYHSANEHFQYLIKTRNHSLKIPMEQLIANRQKQLTHEDFIRISNSLLKNEKQEEKAVATKKNNGWVKSVILGFIVLIIIGLIGFIIALNQEPSLRQKLFSESTSQNDYYEETLDESSYQKPKTEAELKQELYNKECEKATSYIDGKLSYIPIYKNLLSLKVVGLKLKGKLENSATLATFKNIKIKVTFKSYTGENLFSRTFEVYTYISPQSSATYTHEIEVTNQEYEDIADFSWKVVDVGY